MVTLAFKYLTLSDMTCHWTGLISNATASDRHYYSFFACQTHPSYTLLSPGLLEFELETIGLFGLSTLTFAR